MYCTKSPLHCLNQLIIIFTLLLISISQTHQIDTVKSSLKTRSRQGRDADSNEDLADKARTNLSASIPAESRQDEDNLQFGSKPYYSSKLTANDLDDYSLPVSNSFQPKAFERRNSISAPDFQANAAGFVLPDYSSSSNNLLNKLSAYDGLSNRHSSLEEYGGYLNEKNNFVPSSSLRERRKSGSSSSYADGGSSKSNSNTYNIYERQIDDQNPSQYDSLLSAHKHHLMKQHQARDNDFASNSILESVSSPLENQDFGFGNNFNDFATSSSYNNELSALNNLAGLGGIRSLGAGLGGGLGGGLSTLSALSPTLGLNNAYNNLSPLTAASSSLVGTLGGTLNGLSSVVPPGAIVGAPGSSPPPGMKLAGYVTVTNPAPSVGSMASPSNLLASPATQQQMLLNQVMTRNPQAQALAQVMAQSMAQGVRIPFVNPYANNLQLLASANNLNGLSNSNSGSTSSNSGSSSSNSNSASSSSSSSNSNNLASSNGEQQVAASSTNRAKFFSRLNPLNLFKRLRTRNQKNNNSKANKDQANGNDINNNIPDLEDRSQFFLPAELLLGSASTTSQQQQLPQLSAQQQQFADQISAQLAQLNMQLAQQSNNRAKFLRKMGSNSASNLVFPSSSSTTASAKKVAKRDVTNQLNNSSTDEQLAKKEAVSYSLAGEQLPKASKSNRTNSNDTETAENGFFPVADLYQNYKFNIRPRFRFPSVREQRRISNVHGLHVNTNNFLTSSSMKSNFIGLMGSRNYEVISGGILNNGDHRSNTDHSMLHGMHSNNNEHNNQHNHKLPHHHQNQRGHMMPNKGNKFNIDNDFDEDDEEDNDSMNDSGFNSAPMMGNGNGNSNNARNGNNVMFLDDLFGSNMHNNGHDRSNPSMFGFQGFNSFNGNNQHHFNALSSASSYSNQQLNNGTEPVTDHKADDSSPKASTNDSKTSEKPVNANQTVVV